MNYLKRIWMNSAPFRYCIKNRLNRISRPKKVAVYTAINVLLLLLVYMFLEYPTFSADRAYRVAERRNMVGPAKIIDTFTHPNQNNVQVWLGDTGEGVTLYLCEENRTWGTFVYRKKGDELTAVVLPEYFFDRLSWASIDNKQKASIVVFDQVKDAVYAEMDIRLNTQFYAVDENYPDRVFSMQAERQNDDYFCFVYESALKSDWLEERHYLYHLVGTAVRGGSLQSAFPLTVRFYDANRQLITTQNTVLRARSNEVYMEYLNTLS